MNAIRSFSSLEIKTNAPKKQLPGITHSISCCRLPCQHTA